jgi:hypothetical protein
VIIQAKKVLAFFTCYSNSNTTVPRPTVSPSPARASIMVAEPLSPDVVRKALTTFWVVFAGASIVADLNLIPGVSSVLRSIAKRGKEDEDDPEGAAKGAAIAAATAKTKKNDDAAPAAPPKKKKNALASAFFSLTVPHGWFAHFYFIGTIWNALLLLHVLRHADTLTTSAAAMYEGYAMGKQSEENAAGAVYAATSGALVAALFQVHVMRRLVESVAGKGASKKEFLDWPIVRSSHSQASTQLSGSCLPTLPTLLNTPGSSCRVLHE